MPTSRCIIQLGKTGDVLNILPLAHYYAQQGERVAVMSAEPYCRVLDGCSYITKEVWDGEFTDVEQAANEAVQRGYEQVNISQIYGKGAVAGRHCTSFAHESWRAAGALDKWGLPLFIDQRDKAREEALLEKHWPVTRKPVILVCTDGESQPFKPKALLHRELAKRFPQAEVLDLAKVRCERFYDMLAFIDHAAVFVCVDTGQLHLSWASKTPVVALSGDIGSTWYGAPRRPNHICYLKYREFSTRKEELFQAVADALAGRRAARSRIIHAWSRPSSMSEDSQRRHDMAAATWRTEAALHGNWLDLPMDDSTFPVNAKTEYNDACLPFIGDMLDRACWEAKDRDVLLLTNSDINLVPGAAAAIEDGVAKFGAIYTKRLDLRKIDRPLSTADITKRGTGYVGIDSFAFSREWWLAHRAEYPPMVLAREAWDWVMMELIKAHGGKRLDYLTYHEQHSSQWKSARSQLPGNRHNRGWARAWLTERGIKLRELEHQSFEPKELLPAMRVKAVDQPAPSTPKIVGRGQAKVRFRPRDNPMGNIDLPPDIAKKASAGSTSRPAAASLKTTGAKVDVLIVLGTGSKWGNNELRYCLRSMEQHLQNVGRVFVCGSDPGFLSQEVTFLPFPDPYKVRGKEKNITAAILHACKAGISDEFLWVQDDCFFVKDCDAPTFPYLYGTDLAELRDKIPPTNAYRVSLNLTHSALKRAQKPTTSWELHVPIRFRREKFLALQKQWDMSFASHTYGWHCRSIYCNMLNVQGVRMKDMKLKSIDPLAMEAVLGDRPVFSISDDALDGGAKDWLAERFAKPCKWEKE